MLVTSTSLMLVTCALVWTERTMCSAMRWRMLSIGRIVVGSPLAAKAGDCIGCGPLRRWLRGRLLRRTNPTGNKGYRRTNGDGLFLLRNDLRKRASKRCGHFRVNFIGGDFENGFVLLDFVPFLLQPAQHSAFG